tara:strand:- start:913 stop:1380 length:468 start_codon:yes stop_codon:yes gene_type:complete
MPITQRLALIVLITLLLCNGTSSAQTQPENEEAVAGAMAALDEFMITFNARDSQLWARSLNYPHVRFASGTVTVWESAEKFAQTDSFNRLAAIGWDHSHWLSRNVVLVSPAKVHIATKFQRFNEKNESIGTYESLYIVTKVDGHWGTQARSSLAP